MMTGGVDNKIRQHSVGSEMDIEITEECIAEHTVLVHKKTLRHIADLIEELVNSQRPIPPSMAYASEIIIRSREMIAALRAAATGI